MKKLLGILLVLVAAVTMAFTPSRVKDPVQIIDPNTEAMVNDQDMQYQRKAASPQIYLQTQASLHLSAPKHLTGNELVILVGVKGQRANVKIFRSPAVAKWLPQEKCDSIVVSQVKLLKPANKKNFNQGLQKIVQASCTVLEDHYHLPHGANSLNPVEMMHVTNPHRTKLTNALIIAVIAMALFWFARQRDLIGPRHKKHQQ